MFIEKRYKTEMYDPSQGRMSGCFVFSINMRYRWHLSYFFNPTTPK